MSLADIARVETAVRYAPWGRDVRMRPISAKALCDMQSSYGDMQGKDVDVAGALEFYAELLSLSVTDPAATKQEWLEDVTPQDVMTLGQEALRVSGLLADETKKN